MNQAYQLVCCDLDGTLLNEKDEVSEKNKEMIQRCRKQGMQFAIVSGRPGGGDLTAHQTMADGRDGRLCHWHEWRCCLSL